MRRSPSLLTVAALLFSACGQAVVPATSFPGGTPTATLDAATLVSQVATPGASPRPTAPSGSQVALESLGSSGHLLSGLTYTSTLFEPTITFRLATRDGALDTTDTNPDWCSPANLQGPLETSPRGIVLRHPRACAERFGIIRPDVADCGITDAGHDAATVAAALLRLTGDLTATDLGALQSPGSVPARLFLGTYQGRVIRVSRGPAGTEVGRCLLPAPVGEDPRLAALRDRPWVFVLVDVRDEVVVLAVEADSHLLTRIYDISFH